MRLFNDTMSALALNAYEINEANEDISQALTFRNEKLIKMEAYTNTVDQSLDKMEHLLNKMMESI